MKERKYVLGALVACLVIVAAALAGLAAAKPGKKEAAFKVAWIYPGPHNDGGWSQAHDAGRLAVQKALGSKVQTTYKENVFSNASVPQIVAGLVRDGYKMIFATSFGDARARRQRPALRRSTRRSCSSRRQGQQIEPNQSEYFGAAEDTIYLSGMAAGAATKKGVIGYVVPYGIPEVVRHINAFTLGAQATHPGAKVKIVWTNAWFSPPKETAAAKALVASGADVIGQNVDSPAAGVYAEKVGSPVGRLRLGRAEVRAEAVADGGGLQLGPVLRPARQGGDRRHAGSRGSTTARSRTASPALAPYGPKVSAKTKAAIAAKKQLILSGKWNAFCGPIYDQSGKLKIPKGKCLDPNTKAGIDALYSMQWLVKGVVGSVSHVQPPG